MLMSMYPNPGEFVLDDPEALEYLRSVVSGELEVETLESRLGFSVTVSCQEGDKVTLNALTLG